MRKNMPYMVLDITKKPGDPNTVKTGDMILAENTKLREALKKCLLYIACAESVGIGTITLDDKVKLDPKKIIKSAKEALAATEKEGGAK